jgi:uncharacterized protein
MSEKIDNKRILIFITIAFGIAWLAGLVVYLTGGLQNSPLILPGLPLSFVLISIAYMGAPALSNVLTRIITREGWSNTMLRPRFKRGWPFWVAAWLLPGVLTIFGAFVFFLLLPQYFDPQLTTLNKMLETTAIPAWTVIIVQTLQAIIISPLINGFFTFGEEFGWRGYLLPKLMPLGGRKAVLLSGVIWGVWHWPVIAMGHNYGLDYTGAPWLGMLAMVWFTLVAGVFLSWVTLRGGSVWPAVIGHAAINGIAGLALLLSRGEPNPLLGPLPTGLIASAGFTLVALWIFLSPNGLAPMQVNDEPAVAEEIPVTQD